MRRPMFAGVPGGFGGRVFRGWRVRRLYGTRSALLDDLRARGHDPHFQYRHRQWEEGGDRFSDGFGAWVLRGLSELSIYNRERWSWSW